MFTRLIMSILLFFCLPGGTALAAHYVLDIPGTGDSQALLRILAREFEKSNPDIDVVVPDSIGSGGAIKSVARGKAELGRVARPIKKKEEKYGLTYEEFAYSPVVFAVNHSVSGVDNITAAQVVGIYKGSIDNWRQLGGSDRKLYVINREGGDSSRSILGKKIPGFKQIAKPVGKVVYNTSETVEKLFKYKDTIGYVPLSSAKKEELVILKYEGSDPLTSRKYPLVSPLALVWEGKLSEQAGRFKEYLFSKEAVAIVKDFGAIPVSN